MKAYERETSKITKAMCLAADVHKTHRRKGTQIPYVVHPIRVANYLISLKADIDMVCAGAMHDVFEMCPANKIDFWQSEINNEFGDAVLYLVRGLSGTKQELLTTAECVPSLQLLVVMLADKLDNLTDICTELYSFKTDAEVDKFWLRFNGTRESIAQYYADMSETMTNRALAALLDEPANKYALMLVTMLSAYRPLVARWLAPYLELSFDNRELLNEMLDLMLEYKNESGMSGDNTREFVLGCMRHILTNPEINTPILEALKSAEVVE